ncbi:hypothetical protein [Corynebacterium guangdongense]|uniref:DUF423 domain-containing protein n=1 Tax=Corynebacterium guangdongense TaxID=1783348 RepID=A0ABU1ZXG4_9CORY|nr:hypothetical protein [Corynebacterium guangdongense]MDR7329632.1 hypothetical protein [Corynebacterium guangdongense]WJZ18197.1 hypothetical protein CGUA_08175 [Corynebacterium guangdongense]
MLTLSRAGRLAAGILTLSLLTIEFGGGYVLSLTTGNIPATDFQTTFARAGHGHAGILVTLSLGTILLTDAARLTGGIAHLTRWGVPLAAVLMPAGFFLSSIGADRTEPNALYPLIPAGAGVLAISLATLGVALIRSAARRQ